jgi:hypothetical protein
MDIGRFLSVEVAECIGGSQPRGPEAANGTRDQAPGDCEDDGECDHRDRNVRGETDGL